MSRKKIPEAPMSGLKFQEFLRKELERRNSGLVRVSLNQLGTLCGYTGRYISHLLTAEDPNPSTKMMRCILFTLGCEIENPEEDVIPHLKEKGVYDPAIHGVKQK